MFRLAQVSDLHCHGVYKFQLRDLFSKRALGAANLLVRRRRKHNMSLLKAMVRDLRGRAFDHLALTGDMCNIALVSEWTEALRWIGETQLPPERVTAIPGNHDAYIPEVVADGTFERLFAAYQTAELRVDGAIYPFVQLRGEVALVCTSTAVPTGDIGAWGKMGKAQLGRLESLLMAPEVRQRLRVVLIHHPPLVNRPGEGRNLHDREAVQALLAKTGAELVLHGHDHRDFFNVLPGPEGSRIPIVGVGSASYDGPPEKHSRYNIYEIDGSAITVVTYAHKKVTDQFVEIRRKKL
jgi:3',5'-cyclic AMP phosphodiesterase CpdA